MTLQGLAVAVIVPLCTLAAIWQLMGARARRRVAARLATVPLPAAWARRLAGAAAAASACGCDGCDRRAGGSAGAPAEPTVVRVQRRRR